MLPAPPLPARTPALFDRRNVWPDDEARRAGSTLRAIGGAASWHTEPEGDRYTRIEPLRTGQVIHLVALPDVDIALADLLPRA